MKVDLNVRIGDVFTGGMGGRCVRTIANIEPGGRIWYVDEHDRLGSVDIEIVVVCIQRGLWKRRKNPVRTDVIAYGPGVAESHVPEPNRPMWSRKRLPQPPTERLADTGSRYLSE